MPEENGWTEAFRVKFPSTVGDLLTKMSRLESRSVPSLIQQLVMEALSHRQFERKRPAIIQNIISGNETKW